MYDRDFRRGNPEGFCAILRHQPWAWTPTWPNPPTTPFSSGRLKSVPILEAHSNLSAKVFGEVLTLAPSYLGMGVWKPESWRKHFWKLFTKQKMLSSVYGKLRPLPKQPHGLGGLNLKHRKSLRWYSFGQLHIVTKRHIDRRSIKLFDKRKERSKQTQQKLKSRKA